MIIRIAWYVLLAVIAVVSFGVQLDRQSMVQRELAAHVPEAFRGVAQQRLADRALRSGQHEEALELARELVRERPMPAENLMLLGQTQIAAGQPVQGIATVEAATARGWRVVPAQLAVAEAAMEVENYPAAADRLAAVIAIGSEDANGKLLFQRLLASPAGRDAMAARLAGNGSWQRRFARFALETTPAADIWQTMLAAEELGAPMHCEDLSLVLRQIERTLVAETETVPELPQRCAQ